jgi:hypothetical protein
MRVSLNPGSVGGPISAAGRKTEGESIPLPRNARYIRATHTTLAQDGELGMMTTFLYTYQRQQHVEL